MKLVSLLSLTQINMTLRASLQKLKQNIAQLRETLARASSQRRMHPLTSQVSVTGCPPSLSPWTRVILKATLFNIFVQVDGFSGSLRDFFHCLFQACYKCSLNLVRGKSAPCTDVQGQQVLLAGRGKREFETNL